MLHLAQKYAEWSVGGPKVQKEKFAHVGMEFTRAADLSAHLTREDFADAPNPIPAEPEMRASRQRPPSMEDTGGVAPVGNGVVTRHLCAACAAGSENKWFLGK